MAFRRGPMSAGDRDCRVRLEQRPSADALDSSGAPTDLTADVPWTVLVDSMPAAKVSLSGREKLSAEELSAPYDTRWELNYRADMDPDLVDVRKLRRLIYQGIVHDIVDASMINRKDGIELKTLASFRVPV